MQKRRGSNVNKKEKKKKTMKERYPVWEVSPNGINNKLEHKTPHTMYSMRVAAPDPAGAFHSWRGPQRHYFDCSRTPD